MSRWMGTNKAETLEKHESTIHELDTIVDKNMEIIPRKKETRVKGSNWSHSMLES